METWFGDGAITARVDVEAVRRSRRLPVNRHAEANRCLLPRRTHHEMKVARVKAIHDAAIRTLEDRRLPAHRPFAGQRPLIEREARRGRIEATPIPLGAASRREILCSVVA